MDLDALRIFLKVAELGSITRAGAQLGLSKSRVSRRVNALERELDAHLFHRTTRAVRLTADGEALLPRARRIVREGDEIGALFHTGRGLRGQVRVDLPVKIARRVILPALPELLARHPALELFINTTDRLVDAIGEGFDCVLRVGELADSELRGRKLGALPMINCASLGYVERRGAPRSLDELDDHLLVRYAAGRGAAPAALEYEVDGDERRRTMRSLVTVSGTDAYFAACVAGLGIVQIPRIAADEALARGELVEVLPTHRCAPMPVTLLHTHGRRPPARVRAVMDWIAGVLAPYLSAAAA
ncbi:MAG: LysR family transcriptional regulator [Myxococcales bacterium]|nr:LysR family transcriptional regulator [Myxococcales bacterium]